MVQTLFRSKISSQHTIMITFSKLCFWTNNIRDFSRKNAIMINKTGTLHTPIFKGSLFENVIKNKVL